MSDLIQQIVSKIDDLDLAQLKQQLGKQLKQQDNMPGANDNETEQRDHKRDQQCDRDLSTFISVLESIARPPATLEPFNLKVNQIGRGTDEQMLIAKLDGLGLGTKVVPNKVKRPNSPLVPRTYEPPPGSVKPRRRKGKGVKKLKNFAPLLQSLRPVLSHYKDIFNELFFYSIDDVTCYIEACENTYKKIGELFVRDMENMKSSDRAKLIAYRNMFRRLKECMQEMLEGMKEMRWHYQDYVNECGSTRKQNWSF